MNLKKLIPVLALAGTLTLATISCKSKVSDTDLKAKVETVTSGHPNVSVDAKDGVVTLSGTVASDDEKRQLEEAAKNVDTKHIRSVVNNIVVELPHIETSVSDADLINKVIDATKDFPSIQADVKDGVITVTGSLEQARVQTLKMALDALNPKKVDMSGLTVK